MNSNETRAGAYPRGRYEDALRNYRRRLRREFVGLLVLAIVIPVGLALWRGLDWWSYAVGALTGSLIALAVWIRDEPPEFIAKWRRGAEGEERTGKELARLQRMGWSVRHGVDVGAGDADHVVLSPTGRAYVLETKTLAGLLALEHDTLTCRFTVDPRYVRRIDDLEPRLERTVENVARLWRERGNGKSPELRPLVVIWGAFDPPVQDSPSVTYVRGDELVGFLESCDVDARK